MYYLGLDIGGTKCAVSLGEVSGESGKQTLSVLAKKKFPTETGKRSPDAVLDELYTTAEALLAEKSLSFSDMKGIGISCGGPLDAKTGVILSPPNLPGWDHVAAVSYFEEKTGVKTYLQNDANACAVAEWKFGAGRGCENMAFLTFGTGLGSGLILNGRLYSGTSDMAGEIGHVRLTREEGTAFLPVGYGKRGSAEGYCSGGGLAQLGQEAVRTLLAQGVTPRLYEAAGNDLSNITAKLIGDLAEQEEDALCLSLYEKCGARLGETLSLLIDILNPQIIVLGGIFLRSEGLIRPMMERVIESETLRFARQVCRVVPAALGELIGDYAALSVATGEF